MSNSAEATPQWVSKTNSRGVKRVLRGRKRRGRPFSGWDTPSSSTRWESQHPTATFKMAIVDISQHNYLNICSMVDRLDQRTRSTWRRWTMFSIRFVLSTITRSSSQLGEEAKLIMLRVTGAVGFEILTGGREASAPLQSANLLGSIVRNRTTIVHSRRR